jgi:hypothetical protein
MISIRDRDHTAFPTMNENTVEVVTINDVKNRSARQLRNAHNNRVEARSS